MRGGDQWISGQPDGPFNPYEQGMSSKMCFIVQVALDSSKGDKPKQNGGAQAGQENGVSVVFSLGHNSLYQQNKPGIPEAALISCHQFLRKTPIDWDGSFRSRTMAGYEGGKSGLCDVWSVLTCAFIRGGVYKAKEI